MSTTELGRYEARPVARDAVSFDSSVLDGVHWALQPLASLRLTVLLLGLSLILVLIGTLAQIDHDIWYVVHEYFRAWIAWVELRVFFPRSWGISEAIVFPFPGGKLLGVALAANLVAAHAVRFKIAARGARLWLGWATIAIGAAITYLVIVSGSSAAVESELSPGFTNGLWHALRAAVGGAALTLGYVLALTRSQAIRSSSNWLWWIGAVTSALLAALAVYLFTHPEARLDASGLRILWQLGKATGASLVLGAGCWAVFSKRAGIVLLHSGIGLLMFSELYTAQQAVEARMSIPEGATAYYAEDIRSLELAFTEATDDHTDRVTVVPGSILQKAARTGEIIGHADLPFDIRVTKYLRNAKSRTAQPGEEAVATQGIGVIRIVDELPPATGVDDEQTVDVPAACVELLAKDGGESRGVYLATPFLSGDVLTAGDKSYEMSLRFKRVHKPYTVSLLEFKDDQYVGSNTPKDYRSIVRFRDEGQNIDRTVHIWMNNPLRYAGDTLYQADWLRDGRRGTVLQVVTNAGWMVPYVACMIALAGMLVHFLQGIIRFVYRREDESRRQALLARDTRLAPTPGVWSVAGCRRPPVWIPALIVVAFAGWTLRRAAPPAESFNEMKIHEFGKLPVVFGGRTQPMDTLARNTLRLISRRATYEDRRYDERQPAIRWFLDVVSGAPALYDHRVLRIENLDVLQTLGLKRREGLCYSIDEVMARGEELDRQVELARAVPKEKWDLTQAKFVELDHKTRLVTMLMGSFESADVEGATDEEVQASIQALVRRIGFLNNVNAPRPVAPATQDASWMTLLEADTRGLLAQAASKGKTKPDEAVAGLQSVLVAYRDGDTGRFNSRLVDYRGIVERRAAAEQQYEREAAAAGDEIPQKHAESLALSRIRFEAFFNHFDPFVACVVFYIASFVLAALAWMGWSEGFNRAANWLLWFTFAVHTFGLVCRIYISGRPPMTNLYSSAIFIGWAGVLFGLVFEAIYRLGIGNLIAAALGFPTMVIAYYLTFEFVNSGDTLGVMQAVLDTNFWLGTHVVCIGLGYATTFLAGALGLTTIVLGIIGRVLDADQRRQVNRMTYGTLCFAIFFSLIGTVLGGLWADDSWGRFWGWDPKENGALMIVLWNAIALHARWGKMVGERGLAVLTVLGNIVVAWSYFGVNQLGIGLHAYGQAEGRTLWLAIFAASQLAVAAAAYLAPLFTSATAPPRMTSA
jgi:ABC-type transport system involved in cytochrome c biogenesis permease subunit